MQPSCCCAAPKEESCIFSSSYLDTESNCPLQAPSWKRCRCWWPALLWHSMPPTPSGACCP